MKPFKLLITAVFTLLLGLTAQAQWAGEDKAVLRLQNNSQTTTIGQPASSSDMCYEWSGPDIVGERNKPVITVNPRSETCVYTVRRTGKCGVEEDQVIVTLTDTIGIVSVTPTKCYNDGDSITKEDFKIVTSPEGFENLVSFGPTTAHHNVGSVVGTQDVTFYLLYNNHRSTKTIEVTVINDNLTSSGEISVDFKDFKKKLQQAKKMLDAAKFFKSKFLDPVAKNALPCEPDFDYGLEFSSLPQFTYYCCEGKKVDAFNLFGPTLSGSVSLGCQFPIPGVSIPYIGGFYATIDLSAGISVGPLALRFRGDCGQAEIPVELSAEIAGGIRASVVSKDFLSASLAIAAGGKTGMEWVIGKEINWKGVELYLAIKGEVTAISLLKAKVNIPIGSWTFFK